MGRPPNAPGTAGDPWKIDLPGGRVEYRCKFRDYDGKTRQIRRSGPTDRAAKTALKEAIRDRQDRQAGIAAVTKVDELAERWLTEVITPSDKAVGTKQHYGYVVQRYIRPALGQLRVSEVTVGTADRALKAVRERHGAGAARSAKTVLSGVLGYAVRHDAIRVNPTRETSPIGGRRKRPKALTREETDYICDWMRADPHAIKLDLADLVDWMLFTGCRIGEACAARPGLNSERNQLLDLQAGTWEVNATVVRQTGSGLIIQERTKTDAGWRVLALPPAAVEMIRRRENEVRWRHPSGVVFTSPKAKAIRDPSNTPGDLRKVLDGIDCDECGGTGVIRRAPGKFDRCPAGRFSWVTSHVFRKTVATRMEEAGCTPRQVADQLGHDDPSMTLDVYFGRSVVCAAAAVVLNR